MSAASKGFDRLLFSVAGVPHTARRPDLQSGVERVAELGLDAMEVEFVHGVRLNPETGARVRARAAELGVRLTCHGPYYINLYSSEEDKRRASAQRILDTARAAHALGAHSITFHAAFYMGAEPEAVHVGVRQELIGIAQQVRDEGLDVQLRPELTGKPSQYGSLDELLRLSTEVPGVSPCIDFSHLVARTAGGHNSQAGFEAVLDRVVAVLGREALHDLHLHASGIEYTPKGERKHKELKDSSFDYRGLLRALKRLDARGVLVCESPTQEDDTLVLRDTYRRLRVRSRVPGDS